MSRVIPRAWALALVLLVAAPPAGARSDTGSPMILQLGAEGARRAGVELARATAGQLAPEVLAYGRVLDPAPVVTAVARRQAVRAQARRADEELQRIERLARDEQNASARELEAARAAASSARAEVTMAEAGVVGLLGFEAANDSRLPSLTRALERRSAALIRVDVPASAQRPAPERGWWLTAYPGLPHPIAAEYLAEAPDVSPQTPGWGFLFVVDEDPPPPGTRIRAGIRTAGEIRHGVDVPSEALVRDGGEVFVFVARGEGTFERLPVVARSHGNGRWLLEGDVEPGTQVVVSGAQQLLSAQLLGPGASLGD